MIVCTGNLGGSVLRKSNSDMDKIFDLFLYLFPKYLDKIYDQKNNRDTEKWTSIKKTVEKDAFKGDKIKNSNEHHNNNKDVHNSHKDHNSNIDRKEESKIKPEKNDDKLKVDKEENSVKSNNNKSVSEGGDKMTDTAHTTDTAKEGTIVTDTIDTTDTAKEGTIITNTTDERIDMSKNDLCNICVDGIEKILKELVGEKVDISITDSTMFLLNAVTILSVTDNILRLKTAKNTTIIIPIQEIVAIRCNLIYGISFEDDCDSDTCEREESLRRYFASIIGKKVSLQTKGEGEFKYINNRIITSTGKGIVIIEGTIAISLSKITLIEEIT